MDWTTVAHGKALSVPDRLSVDLERLIIDGKLVPGERLPSERDLASHLGVSRVSIREALRELENRGLIDRRPGRGTIVLEPRERMRGGELFGAVGGLRTEISDIMELRMIIEPPIARLTAQRATARDLAQLRHLVEDMETDVPLERYAELDEAFHQTIARYTHNPLLAAINEHIAQEIAPSRANRFQTKERRSVSSASHRRIYEAIAAGDGDAAEHEAREHLRSIRQEIVRAVESSPMWTRNEQDSHGEPGEQAS